MEDDLTARDAWAGYLSQTVIRHGGSGTGLAITIEIY